MEQPPVASKESHNTEGSEPYRVFIEMGTNEIAVPFLGEKEFNKKNIYIGIDKNIREVHDARRHGARDKEAKPHLSYTAARGEDLPLQAEVADELYFGNVFGDPSIPIKEQEKFLDEAWRTLKPNGMLTVKETNTPQEFKIVKDLLRKKGFSIEKIVRGHDKEWREQVSPYDTVTTKKPFDGSYLIHARKAEKNSTP